MRTVRACSSLALWMALAAACLGAVTTASAADENGDRLLWKVQHILGAAQLSERKGEFSQAVAKVEEAEAVLAEWKEALKAKHTAVSAAGDSTAAAAAQAESAPPPEPVEFFVNTTHAPPKCTQTTRQGSVLKIHYVAKDMATNKVVASSFHTGSTPFRFVLGSKDVIEGWNRGLEGMCMGERRRLLVPYTLAFGSQGTKQVPPYTNLRYDVELVEFLKPKDET